jgi:hypothetical protein
MIDDFYLPMQYQEILSHLQSKVNFIMCWCQNVAGQGRGSLPSQARELAEWWTKASI